MRLQVYLVGMVLATLMAWVSLAAILDRLEPTATAGLSILALFYLSLFIAVSGALFLANFFLRRIINRKGVAAEQADVSFRQGILLSVILVSALILQSQGMLVWWSLLVLVAIAGIVEWWATRRQ